MTKPGLPLNIGEPAINPAPRRMIEKAVQAVLQRLNEKGGVCITISVPGGERLAEKTLNERLGIKGGISILGTTGIVIPYSINAYKACISQAVGVAAACGCRSIVLSTGRRSEAYARSALNLPDESFIQAGDFIGHSLSQCSRRKIQRVIIWGMVGKLSKLAAGHLYTNISDSRVDIAFLAGLAAECGIPASVVDRLSTAVTANHLRRLLPTRYSKVFCDSVCLSAARRCSEFIKGRCALDCIMSSPDGARLGEAHLEG